MTAANGYSQFMPPVQPREIERPKVHNAIGLLFTCLIGIWMFVLGVFVGRYTTPVELDTGRALSDELAIRRNAEAAEDRRTIAKVTRALYNEDLEFYDKLRHQQKPEGGADAPDGSINAEMIADADAEKAPPAKTKTKTALTQKPSKSVAATVRKPEADPPAETKKAARESERLDDEDVEEIIDTGGGTGRFVIQVASFISADDARDLVAKLKSRGYTGAYQIGEKIAGTLRHRVKVGFFPDRRTATPTLKRLQRKEGLSDAYVVTRN